METKRDELQQKYEEENRRNKEELDRQKFYKDVESIKNYIKFFFLLTIVGAIALLVMFFLS